MPSAAELDQDTGTPDTSARWPGRRAMTPPGSSSRPALGALPPRGGTPKRSASAIDVTAPQPQPPSERGTRTEEPTQPRSTQREALARLHELQLPALEARANLAGIGHDPALATSDDAVKARLLTDLNHDDGLVAPQVSVQAHLIVDMHEAAAVLDRILVTQGVDLAAIDATSEPLPR